MRYNISEPILEYFVQIYLLNSRIPLECTISSECEILPSALLEQAKFNILNSATTLSVRVTDNDNEFSLFGSEEGIFSLTISRNHYAYKFVQNKLSPPTMYEYEGVQAILKILFNIDGTLNQSN